MWVIVTASFTGRLLMVIASAVFGRGLDFSNAQTKNQRSSAIFLITFVMSIAGFTAEGLQRYVEKVVKIGVFLLHDEGH